MKKEKLPRDIKGKLLSRGDFVTRDIMGKRDHGIVNRIVYGHVIDVRVDDGLLRTASFLWRKED